MPWTMPSDSMVNHPASISTVPPFVKKRCIMNVNTIKSRISFSPLNRNMRESPASFVRLRTKRISNRYPVQWFAKNTMTMKRSTAMIFALGSTLCTRLLPGIYRPSSILLSMTIPPLRIESDEFLFGAGHLFELYSLSFKVEGEPYYVRHFEFVLLEKRLIRQNLFCAA